MGCGTHHYANIDEKDIKRVLEALKGNGATVTGDNPYEVDTNKYGVKLSAKWNSAKDSVAVEVTDKEWWVPCSKIWETIDPLMAHVSEN